MAVAFGDSIGAAIAALITGGSFSVGGWNLGVPGCAGRRYESRGFLFGRGWHHDALLAGGAMKLATPQSGFAFNVLPAINAGEFAVNFHAHNFLSCLRYEIPGSSGSLRTEIERK
jgi:hypothetical protein